MIYNIFSTLTQVLGRFFLGSGFFRIGSGFLNDPDPDSEKKYSDPDPEKNPGSETLLCPSSLISRNSSLTTHPSYLTIDPPFLP